MSILEARSLDAGYEHKIIAKKISLTLEAGKVVALVGPNGSGKSTILKTLASYLPNIGGQVLLNGEELNKVSAHDRADAMSVMLTDRIRVEYTTVFDVVAAGRYQYTGIWGKLSSKDKDIINSALKRVNSFGLIDDDYNKLSDGQKQRVLLARALVQEPKVMILDEPTSFLDIGYKLEFMELVKELSKNDGIGILMSMHELELVKYVSDEVICITSEGNLGRIGTPSEVLTYDYLKELFQVKSSGFDSVYDFSKESRNFVKDEVCYNKDRRTKYIFVQGTMSNAGKSLIVAGLCRIFMQDGYRVAPFKSQNMALNSYVTADGLEMGRAQVMQAEAAGVKPSVYMNPILLKPTGHSSSQVIVNGEVVENMSSKEYFAYKKGLKSEILKAVSKLEENADIIVVEGAGSPVELNLKNDDIVNMGLAKMLDAPVLLVGDIDRGGIFAQLCGTVDLLSEEERQRVCGIIVNKFRGDKSLFDSGIKILEDRCGIDVLGVMPWISLNIEDEDSLSEKFNDDREGLINIGVIYLPHISNFTDFDVFRQINDVAVRFIDKPSELEKMDMLIIPGTKNTLADMEFLNNSGLSIAIKQYAKQGNIVFGICGGYQLLGLSIKDPLKVEGGGEAKGLGLLPVETVLTDQKIRTQVRGTIVDPTGALACLKGSSYDGYEIHMGVTTAVEAVDRLTENETGYCLNNIYGSYIHGIFDSKDIVVRLLDKLAKSKGVRLDCDNIMSFKELKDVEYNRLAASMRENLDIDRIYEILGVR